MTTSRFSTLAAQTSGTLALGCSVALFAFGWVLPGCGSSEATAEAAERGAASSAANDYAAGLSMAESQRGAAASGEQGEKPSNAAARSTRRHERMVKIPAGKVLIEGDEQVVDSFWMDQYEVTNRDFEAFVKATGFVTEAERIGNSVVFYHHLAAQGEQPFAVVDGAHWRAPTGPGSNVAGKADHPAVHVSWNDAVAYAKWAGKRLATRAEWVHAASAGAASKGAEGELYPWGNEIQPARAPMMNSWQGVFPVDDRGLDGFRGTSPVGAFPPNAFGLYDVAGNVWEWNAERATVGDGPEDELAEKRGGSFLCREEAALGFHACQGYRIDAYEWSPVINGNDNVGFRCVRSAED
ncbi:MAG: SUMF1/EgtB/PvdO family nonheme iron enzyme [Planctomycetota bacterium]